MILRRRGRVTRSTPSLACSKGRRQTSSFLGGTTLLMVAAQSRSRPPFARASRRLSQQAVRSLGQHAWHPDHTGGNEMLVRGRAVIARTRQRARRLSPGSPRSPSRCRVRSLPRSWRMERRGITSSTSSNANTDGLSSCTSQGQRRAPGRYAQTPIGLPAHRHEERRHQRRLSPRGRSRIALSNEAPRLVPATV